MLSDIKGIGVQTEKKLNELKIFSEIDLIKHIPRSYMDMTILSSPFETTEGQFCFFRAVIVKISRPFKKGKLEILKAECIYEGRKIYLTWFNRNYLSKILKTDVSYNIYGKLKIDVNMFVFYNPIFEEESEGGEMFGIHPVYFTNGLIPQKSFSKLVAEAMNHTEVKSIIDPVIEDKYNLQNLKSAYKAVHFPESNNIYKAKERITIENIVRRICAFRVAKQSQIESKKRVYNENIDYTPVLNLISFKLNDSQIDAIKRIEKVFCSKEKVNAILCGDVGSGKTIVATLAIYFVVKNGYTAALMAPTEVLAKQHFRFISSLFSELGISVAFLSGNTTKSEKEKIYEKLKKGTVNVIIGTHSLINAMLEIPNLGFVVIDEQHRFGVAQRTRLLDKGNSVDVLTLSATPIPRSMQLVAYGEVEFITIARRYTNTVKTAIVGKNKRENMWKYIANETQKGNLAYIVAPRIYDEEGKETDSVETLVEEIANYFESNKIGILHGKMKTCEKDAVLQKFSNNEKTVLISTTVIEVGIDVPQASNIVIMNAERFGLATLHQLRGRVGRNGQKAYCFLYTENEPSEGLKMMCSCNDGFEIAEKDFELRGSGDVFGLEQSGGTTLSGLNLRTLKTAGKIVDEIDMKKIIPMLKQEIADFSLNFVSLN